MSTTDNLDRWVNSVEAFERRRLAEYGVTLRPYSQKKRKELKAQREEALRRFHERSLQRQPCR